MVENVKGIIQSDLLSTPTAEYASAELPARIHFIGMIHIAHPFYYEAARQTIADRQADGAIVHYEYVRDMSPEQRAHLDPKNNQKLKDFEWSFKELYKIFNGSGLVKQKDHLSILPDWENHDVGLFEVIDGLSTRQVKTRLVGSRLLSWIFQDLDGEKRIELQERVLTDIFDAERKRSMLAKIGSLLLGGEDKVVLQMRNNVALAAVDDQLHKEPERDIVLLWGSGHLAGIGDGLEERGFEKVATGYMPAIDLSRLRASRAA